MFYGDCKDEICREFRISDFDGVVLFWDYTYEDYNGDAVALYVHDGKFYYVEGSHCSCYGLEEQWAPEEMTVDMVRHLSSEGYGKVRTAAHEVLRVLDELNLMGAPDDHIAVAMKLRFS